MPGGERCLRPALKGVEGVSYWDYLSIYEVCERGGMGDVQLGEEVLAFYRGEVAHFGGCGRRHFWSCEGDVLCDRRWKIRKSVRSILYK